MGTIKISSIKGTLLGHIILWGRLGGDTAGSLGDVLTGIWGDPVTLGPHRPLIGWFSHRCEGQCVSVHTSCNRNNCYCIPDCLNNKLCKMIYKMLSQSSSLFIKQTKHKC